MCVDMPSKFKYNHAVWFKYSFSSFGFDMFQAGFEASIPSRPIRITAGKWYIDVRFLKWQVLINKMTKGQLARALAAKPKSMNPKNSRFDNPSFDL